VESERSTETVVPDPMIDAERDAPDASIAIMGDALWWAITTVGYGDRYPTTTTGRAIAVELMMAGIALLGVVTATLASWLVDRYRRPSGRPHDGDPCAARAPFRPAGRRAATSPNGTLMAHDAGKRRQGMEGVSASSTPGSPWIRRPMGRAQQYGYIS
jgi:hypothetical protein